MRSLRAQLSDSAHDTLQEFVRIQGITMTGFIESQACWLRERQDQWRADPAGFVATEPNSAWIIKCARKLDAERRRRSS